MRTSAWICTKLIWFGSELLFKMYSKNILKVFPRKTMHPEFETEKKDEVMACSLL